MFKKLEGLLENFIFNSRWLLTPIYIVLVLTLIIIGVKTVQEFLYEITHIFEMTVNDLLIFVLHIVDLALVANLVLILIMSSYSSFVSRIEIAEDSVDTPKFLGKVGFKDLKLKVIASIIAISSIGLLEAFVDTSKKKHLKKFI